MAGISSEASIRGSSTARCHRPLWCTICRRAAEHSRSASSSRNPWVSRARRASAATMPCLAQVSPRSTAAAWPASLVPASPDRSGTAFRQLRSVRCHSASGCSARSGRWPRVSSRTMSTPTPGRARTSVVRLPSTVRAHAAGRPDQRRAIPPADPVQLPSASRDNSAPERAWVRPNPGHGSSTTRIGTSPSTPRMRRNTTARSGSPGKAIASRHSTKPSSVTHRLCQISDRSS